MLSTLKSYRRGFFLSLIILPATLLATAIHAQTVPNGASTNTLPNLGNSNPGRLNDVKPIRQPNSVIDSSRGSQQFFNRGREQLFFLPDNNPESILEIDEELEGTEGENQESKEELEQR